MSDLLARLDTMIEGLTAAGSSRCARSTDDAQTPTGTAKPLEVKAVPAVPVVPAEKQDIIREPDISRAEEQSLQRSPRGEAPLSLSSKMTGTTVTTGTGQDFRGVERSRNFITNGNNGNSKAWPGLKIALHANATPAALEEEERTVSTADFIDVGSPSGHESAASELLKDDLVAQLKAYEAEIVDVRSQPRCSECQEPITSAVSDWLGGLPVHHACGIVAWRREWRRDP